MVKTVYHVKNLPKHGGGTFDIVSPHLKTWGDMSPLSPPPPPMIDAHDYALNLFHYFRSNGLNINPSKSQFMNVCNKQKWNQVQCDIAYHL